MKRYRSKMKRGRSRKYFSKTASRVHKRNGRRSILRGGYRI